MRSILALIYVVALSSSRAAPFVNLGFDAANTNNVQPISDGGPVLQGVGSVSDLLPGWQVYHGSTPLTEINFNSLPPASDVMSLTSQAAGGYALSFFNTVVPYSLLQRGDVPAGATALQFNSFSSPINVSVDGTLLTPSGSFGSVDISPWAGKNVELQFSTIGSSFGTRGLDAIRFVPESPPMLLLACAMLGLFWVRRRCIHRS